MTMTLPRGRGAPILDDGLQDSLRRRGTEAIGLAAFAAGALIAVVLGSYAPEDPSPFNATGSAPQNLLGFAGAQVAGSLVFALGWAAAGLPAALIVWGGRLMLHRGEERVLTRMLLAIVAILGLAAFLASHVPPSDWPQRFGLGGMIGDSLLANLLALAPVPPQEGVKLASLIMAPLVLALTALGLGLNWPEFHGLLRFCVTGFTALLRLLARLAVLSGRMLWAGALRLQAVGRDRLAERARRRMAEERQAAARRAPPPGPMRPDDDRLMARITAAVRAREQLLGEGRTRDTEPPLAQGPAPEADPPPRLGPAIGRVVVEEQDPPPAVIPMVQRPAPRSAPPSRQAQSEAQPSLPLGEPEIEPYDAPPLALLTAPSGVPRHHVSDDALEENARLLENVLEDYGIRGEITAIRPGPVVTLYELEPAPGLKASRVIGLADDIARSMSALSARIATVPGRSVIGIELPNAHRERVLLREILAAKAFGDSAFRLPIALGKDIGGEPVVANLARMPHLLIAGTTGSGKSVAINTMILSLLYRLPPRECRLIMIDPKMLELSVYDGIPHLLAPVVTDPKRAVVALKWVVAEMEERYRKMSKLGVRNIDGYNARVADVLSRGEGFTRTIQTGFDEATGEPIFEQEEFAPEAMPFIVVIVDEMADLMMVAGKEIEACIQRLAQMARASGIHLIMATQRPSVDVITGTIKANFPTRISFQVTSKIDSRTILGEQGAEQLLGNGDMLYMAGGGRIRRLHGPFVSDGEV
ncbi:MAG TPA: DNA translocase FtsK, partial [Paracoccaceae bacterium]|nr:DNA translocase FtsK [Paracoccaceae bacterium]